VPSGTQARNGAASSLRVRLAAPLDARSHGIDRPGGVSTSSAWDSSALMGVASRDRGQGGRETGSSARHMLATPALRQLGEPAGAEITSLSGMLMGNSKNA
jgi:hypothetical protein